MKRILVIALICVAFICIFTAARSDSLKSDLSNISVFEIGCCDPDFSEAAGIQYFDCFTSSYDDFNPNNSAKNMDVTFNGEVISGNYWYSLEELRSPYPHASDYYIFSGGLFSVNIDSSQLETIVFTDYGSGDKSVDECKVYAEDIARQYFDLSQCELACTAGDNVHSYQFTKIGTADRLSVGVSTSGDIATFSNFTNTSFNKIAEIENSIETSNSIKILLSPDVIKKIEDKIHINYENCASYEILSRRLVKLKDNKMGMIYTLDIEFEPVPAENNTFDIMSARIELLVCEMQAE